MSPRPKWLDKFKVENLVHCSECVRRNLVAEDLCPDCGCCPHCGCKVGCKNNSGESSAQARVRLAREGGQR